MRLNELTIREAHDKLVKKEISSVELTEAVFAAIEEKDETLHCFLTKTKELALETARTVDEKIKDGDAIDILAGIPVAIKDNILVEGIRATAGSKILESYIASYDATVTKRLKKRHAVIVGKTNLDEFAMGSSTENSAFGPTRNPRDPERVPGGSSGGSAAAVAAHECIYALGSDTGGSIREPAAFCGVVGLKPTYGAVSRHGLIAMASSLDQIGPFAKTVEDAAIVFGAISGKDPLDSTSVDYSFTTEKLKTKNDNLKTIRIGVPQEYFVEGIDPAVEQAVRAAIAKLEELGARVEDVSLPHTKYGLACYYLIMPSEVSANLARYDGIRYGYSVGGKRAKEMHLLDIYLKSREEGFGDEVRRRIVLGTYALSAGYYDAYYLKAQKVRTLIKQDFERAFEKCDVIITPTTPTAAFAFGEKADDPLSMYLSDVYTVSLNLAGVPGISIPCETAGNLPIGLQIIGKQFDEAGIFRVAAAYESASR